MTGIRMTARALEFRAEILSSAMFDHGMTAAEMREMAQDEGAVAVLDVICQLAADEEEGTSVAKALIQQK